MRVIEATTKVYGPVAPLLQSRRGMTKIDKDKLKSDVKGVLTHRVRVGFFTVPLWILASALVLRQVMRHRRTA